MTIEETELQTPENWGEPSLDAENKYVRAGWVLLLVTLSVLIYLPSARDTLINNPSDIIEWVFLNPLQLLITAIGVGAIAIALHEKSHQIVASELGYPSTIKWRQLFNGNDPFNYIPNQWIDGREYNLILLAPLFIVNSIAASLVVMDISPLVTYISTAILIINTSAAGDDLHKFLSIKFDSRQVMIRHHIDDGSLRIYRSSKGE